MSLSWTTNFTHTEFRIFRGKIIAGLLKVGIWKRDGYGELDGNLLRFKIRGFWQKTAEIRDIDDQRVLGQIRFRFFGGGATITYDNMEYEWRYHSWTRRKWSVQKDGIVADFKAKGFWQMEGEIENPGIPAAVVLASLFVHLHFRKVAAATH